MSARSDNGAWDTLTDGQSNAAFYVNGGNDTVDLGGNDFVHLANGGGYVVNGSNDGIGAGTYVNATVNGGNDTITADGSHTSLAVNGSANTVNAGESNFTSVAGDVNTVNANGGAVSVLGSSNLIDASLAVVSVADNSVAQVVGTGDTVEAGAGDIVGIAGDSNDLAWQTGGAALFSGTGNTANVNGTDVESQDGNYVALTGNAGNTADFRAQMAQSPDVMNAIDVEFEEVLAREADPAGMASFQAEYAAGASLDDIRTALAYSQEESDDLDATYASIGAPAPTSQEVAGFQEIMAVPYDTPIEVVGPDGIMATTTAGNILSELPAFETIANGRTLAVGLPDGSTLAFGDTERFADFMLALSIQKSQATDFTMDVFRDDLSWLNTVDQPMLALADHLQDLANYNTSVGNADQAALSQVAANLAMQIAAMSPDTRHGLSQVLTQEGHQVEVTVESTSGEPNGTPVKYHNLDPGILGILEEVGIIALNIAAIANPEIPALTYAAIAVDLAQAGEAFANGQVVEGLIDLASATAGGANLDGDITLASEISTIKEAVGGVYGAVQGIQNGDPLGAVAGLLQTAAAAASGIGQIDKSLKTLTDEISSGLGIAATATSVGDQFAHGNLAGGLITGLGPILTAIAQAYSQQQAEITSAIAQSDPGYSAAQAHVEARLTYIADSSGGVSGPTSSVRQDLPTVTEFNTAVQDGTYFDLFEQNLGIHPGLNGNSFYNNHIMGYHAYFAEGYAAYDDLSSGQSDMLNFPAGHFLNGDYRSTGGVQSGQISDLVPGVGSGTIKTYVTPDKTMLFNVTESSHDFSPGLVQRFVAFDSSDQRYHIFSFGEGAGLGPIFNQSSAALLFNAHLLAVYP